MRAEASPAQAAPTSALDEQATGRQAKLQAQMRGGAAWFYWVVGLSVVNSILLAFQVGIAFMFGLGITQVLDGLATELRPELGLAITVIHLALYAGVVAVFVLLGLLASRGHSWAFALGMIAYLFDGLILLPFEDWLGAGFHAIVLYWIWNGFSACRQLRNGPATSDRPL